MSHVHLPQIMNTRRSSMSYDLDKLRKIHEKRQQDWEKLDNKIKNRHQASKLNEETSFMRDLWAFQESGKELAKSIEDTSGFKKRRKNTIKKALAERFNKKFNWPTELSTPRRRLNLT
jgi:hypothetical protein